MNWGTGDTNILPIKTPLTETCCLLKSKRQNKIPDREHLPTWDLRQQGATIHKAVSHKNTQYCMVIKCKEQTVIYTLHTLNQKEERVPSLPCYRETSYSSQLRNCILINCWVVWHSGKSVDFKASLTWIYYLNLGSLLLCIFICNVMITPISKVC